MDVCPKEIINFLLHKELSVTTKHIWMAAKDSHACLDSEAMATTDSDEGDDLLELTKTDGKESELFDDSSKESAHRKVMKGTIEQVKLQGKWGLGGKNVVNDKLNTLNTSIGVEATDDGCEENEIDLVLLLNSVKQITLAEGKQKKHPNHREYWCRTVKLVQRNKKNEQVVGECKWDKKKTRNAKPRKLGSPHISEN